MSTVTALEAKTRFGELLERVASGEEIVITRHERAIARIIPEPRKNLSDVSAAVDALRALRERILERGAGELTTAEAKSAISEGRR